MNLLKLNLFIIGFSIVTTPTYSQVETSVLSDQIKKCKENKAMVWDGTLNRCVYKKEDVQTQNKVENCGKISDQAQREKCHLEIAEDKTDISSNPDQLGSQNSTKSMIMNGSAVAAYFAVDALNKMFAKDANMPAPTDTTNVDGATNASSAEPNSSSGEQVADNGGAENTKTDATESGDQGKNGKNGKDSKKCMSKQILGVTGVAGLATDVWMKISTKKKMKELKDSYQVDLESNAYDGQMKAFEYLKKEQETVIEMAGFEKKRNMALMAGYGAALAMSVWEGFINKNPSCQFYNKNK